jgi:hypothetical protein
LICFNQANRGSAGKLSTSYDQQNWLDRVGKHRPLGGASFTQEILNLVGPPPIPPLGGRAGDMIEHFTAIEVIALNAGDRHLRALLKGKNIRESHGNKSDLDDAGAEANFWAQVRDWAQALK